MSLNHICVSGRLTADPELRRTQSGKAVASFTVACEQDYKGQDGTRKTDFFDCVAWGNSGEFVSEYFHKGDMMILSGRLTNRDWTDKAGNKRRTAEIVVEGSYFGGGKKSTQSENNGVTPGVFTDAQIPESDLPF